MKIHVQAASIFATSVVAFASRNDRIGSFGKIGWMGQLLEPFDTAVKLNLTVYLPLAPDRYFAVSS